jgi:ClpP class serine protease
MADTIRAAAAVKPVIALVNGMAASAAYAMASAASRIVTIPSGVSGSIGVVMLHLDRSKQLAEAGIRPTLIFAGDHKVDGNPFEALPAAVAAEFKAECDALRAMFVGCVAKGRAALTPEAILATQARCFTGADAVVAGLADEVGTLDTIIAQHQSARAPGGSMKGPFRMSTIALADHEKALATARTDAHAFGMQAGKAEGATALAAAQAALATAKADGAKAERERVAGILGHAEAEGRSKQASHLAFSTDMTAEAAVGLLAASAKETAPAAAAPSRMDRTPNPAVLPDGAGGEGPSASAAWGSVMETVNREATHRF